MHVTAHPDDEDGGLLTWLSRSQGARVSLLTLNRGEGGANLVTADFFDELGALRTLELLQAGQYWRIQLQLATSPPLGVSAVSVRLRSPFIAYSSPWIACKATPGRHRGQAQRPAQRPALTYPTLREPDAV